MKTRSITFIAFAAAAAAAIAWGAFAMFAIDVLGKESDRSIRAVDAETISERESAAMRLHTLARDTKSDRDQLDILMQAEILGVVNIIENVGKSTGVIVTISGATPETEPRKSGQQAGAVTRPFGTISFLVEAEGTFSSLMHTALLFENLPILSSVQNLELERISVLGSSPKTKKQLWRLSARIQVVSAADISS
ncbi:MAG: hypothetical protein Q7S05_04460 [bacterium]|nr:hypothetical protein [bacterium]